MSHERTITIEADGKHYILPTVVNGQAMSADDAVKAWRAGNLKALGVFDSQEQADTAAKQRSESRGIIENIMQHQAPPAQTGNVPMWISGKRA